MKAIKLILIVGLLLLTYPAIAQDKDPIDERIAVSVFQPVETIIDTELLVTNFASDGTATLPISTTIPVACSIVYGTTPEFGNIAVDQDMDGGSHADHSPLLTGLQPETTYYFRVQGVDNTGTIYLSDVMTFTTPAFEQSANNNLLSPENGAQILGVSSNYGNQANDGSWGILNAFDGSANTAWSSNGDGDDAWVEVALAERAQIKRVEFWTRFMSNNTAQIFEFTITTESGEVFGPFELPDAQQAYTFDIDIEAEKLRFDVVSSNGGNTGAVEIAVYGEIPGN